MAVDAAPAFPALLEPRDVALMDAALAPAVERMADARAVFGAPQEPRDAEPTDAESELARLRAKVTAAKRAFLALLALPDVALMDAEWELDQALAGTKETAAHATKAQPAPLDLQEMPELRARTVRMAKMGRQARMAR